MFKKDRIEIDASSVLLGLHPDSGTFFRVPDSQKATHRSGAALMVGRPNPSISLQTIAARDIRNHVPRTDYHLHTWHTDGQSSVEDFAQRAIELGLDAIGFPEHANLRSTWKDAFYKDVLDARERFGDRVSIAWGIESRTTNFEGDLAVTNELAEAAEFIYGAFHSSFTDTKFPALPLSQAIDMEHRALLGIAKNATADVLAHPGGLSEKYHGEFPLEMFEDIAQTAASNGVIVEINSHYTNMLADQIATCERVGATIVLGSNAHHVDNLGDIQRALSDIGIGTEA
jgi:putative hydrolase